MISDYPTILRCDLMSFIERSFYELNPQTELLGGPHLELIAAKLEACRRGKIKRLIVNLPPRQLKSHCASVAFPAWCLGHDPAAQIICASYGQDLADKFARDCRRIMASGWYRQLFSTRLGDRHPVHDFATTQQGTRMATSVGGVLTGRGADMIIIDDALKPDEALSESRRNAVNEWYDHTLLTRLNDKERGSIVIIMQRLHANDVSGLALSLKLGYDHLCLPMEFETSRRCRTSIGFEDPRTEEGELLFPARFPAEVVQRDKVPLGQYGVAGQFQQRPAPRDGGLFKRAWFGEPVLAAPPGTRWVRHWDLAASKKRGSGISQPASSSAKPRMAASTSVMCCDCRMKVMKSAKRSARPRQPTAFRWK